MVQITKADQPYHRNVWLAFTYQLLYGIAFSVALGPLFDVYLFQIGAPGHKNILVGKVESVSGLVALALVIPVGGIVDKYDRVKLMYLASAAGFISSGLGAAAIIKTSIPLWYATMIVNGFYVQLGNSLCYVLFADSIAPEQRPKATATMGIISNLAQSCGPMMTFFSMLYLGNSWSTEGLEKVLMFGMVILNPICCVGMLFFVKAPYQQSGEDEDGTEPVVAVPRVKGAAAVPYLIASSDLVTCIGAGMTIKYFNLYWKNVWHMSPLDVLAIAAVQPLSVAFFIKLLEKPSEMCGRARTSCICFFIGALAFLVIAFVPNLPVVLLFYFIRSGMANAVYPLNKSIMFDFTPSETRGRWNAVETLSGSVWSGSAFIGGLLSDGHGYGFTFVITAGIYMFAMLIYSPVVCIAKDKKGTVGAPSPLAKAFFSSPTNPGVANIISPAGPAPRAMAATYATPSGAEYRLMSDEQ